MRTLVARLSGYEPEYIAVVPENSIQANSQGEAESALVRDNDGAYGQVFRRRVRAMGIRDRPISPRSPWQNPYAERLIGTLRRDCLDHVVIFGARHLQRILAAYTDYYNQTRTHLSLNKDAPFGRVVQRQGAILAVPILWAASLLRADMIFGKDNWFSAMEGRPSVECTTPLPRPGRG